jgi:hypothetical protein
MLWLGFDRLNVKVPDSLTGFGGLAVEAHDRLIVSDTGNTVRWYLKTSDVNLPGEFQCPEWSTHPDYIACLTGRVAEPYRCLAVRVSDRATLGLCNDQLDEFSTPHFWLPDSATHGGAVDTVSYDSTGFIKRELVHRFFGTTRFKLVYTMLQRGGTIYFMDYSGVSGNPAPVALRKPQGLENWYCQSPLISPDGGWVTYHCFPNASQGTYYRSYIQRLAGDALPVLVADRASDPHWWVDPEGGYYIVYAATPGPYYSEYDYTDRSVESAGIAGATMLRRLKGSRGAVPSFLGGLAPDETDAPHTLINLPFKGGLSPDGFFLCTAYRNAYLLRIM